MTGTEKLRKENQALQKSSSILRFSFHLFVNCKLSLVNGLSLYFLYFARIVPPQIALLAAGNTFVILFVY